jgi:hypothetical protein
MLADAADDQHFHVVVDIGAQHEVGVALARGNRRRVEEARPVQRDRRDLGRRVLLVEDDFLGRGPPCVVWHVFDPFVRRWGRRRPFYGDLLSAGH